MLSSHLPADARFQHQGLVRVLAPPYDALSGACAEPCETSVLAIDLRDLSLEQLPDVIVALPQLRRRFHRWPLVAILPDSMGGLSLILPQIYGARGLAGVVLGAHSLRTQLRQILTAEHQLTRQVADWLLMERPDHHRGTTMVQYLLGLDANVSLDETAYRHLASRGTLTRFLRSNGLPSADQIRRLGLGVRAAVRIQARPCQSLSRVAHASGLSGSSSLSRFLRREFDATSTEIRRTLGWEWLLNRWRRLQRSDCEWATSPRREWRVRIG